MDKVDYPALLADPSFFDILSDWEDRSIARDTARQARGARLLCCKSSGNGWRMLRRLPIRERLEINEKLNSLDRASRWVTRNEMRCIHDTYNVRQVQKRLFGKGILGLPRYVIDGLLSHADDASSKSRSRSPNVEKISLQDRARVQDSETNRKTSGGGEAARDPVLKRKGPEIANENAERRGERLAAKRVKNKPKKPLMELENDNSDIKSASYQLESKPQIANQQLNEPKPMCDRTEPVTEPQSTRRCRSKRGRGGRKHRRRSNARNSQMSEHLSLTKAGSSDSCQLTRFSSLMDSEPRYNSEHLGQSELEVTAPPDYGFDHPISSLLDRVIPRVKGSPDLTPSSRPSNPATTSIASHDASETSVSSHADAKGYRQQSLSQELKAPIHANQESHKRSSNFAIPTDKSSPSHVLTPATDQSADANTEDGDNSPDEDQVERILDEEWKYLRTREDRSIYPHLRQKLGRATYAKALDDGSLTAFVRQTRRERRSKGMRGPRPSELEGVTARFVQEQMPWLYEEEQGRKQTAQQRKSRGLEVAQDGIKTSTDEDTQAEPHNCHSDSLSVHDEDSSIVLCATQLSNELRAVCATSPTTNTSRRNSIIDTGKAQPQLDDIVNLEDVPNIQPTVSLDSPRKVSAGRRQTKTKSPYFPTATPPKKRKIAGGTTSALPFPPLTQRRFGLIQETVADNPFHLLIGCMFLNRTKGCHAADTFFSLTGRFQTPSDLAEADVDQIVGLINHLGLQNQRALNLICMATKWVENPPQKGKRYRRLHYPREGDGRDIRPQEVLADNDEDERVGAWEVAHLSGVGDYALDSWRIFCRDKARGLAEDWKGGGAKREEFEPEWKRVLPKDKELRAFLRWMWMKEGWLWDAESGERRKAEQKLIMRANRGCLFWDQHGRIVDESGDDHDNDGEDEYTLQAQPPRRNRKMQADTEDGVAKATPSKRRRTSTSSAKSKRKKSTISEPSREQDPPLQSDNGNRRPARTASAKAKTAITAQSSFRAPSYCDSPTPSPPPGEVLPSTERANTERH